MRVGIFSNIYKDEGLKVTRLLMDALAKNHVSFAVDTKIAQTIKGYEQLDLKASSQLDMIFVLGGDGTILKVAPFAAQNDIPILGINLGNLGFLTEIEIHQIHDVINKLINKDYAIEQRSMLKVVGQSNYLALNDAAISRDQNSNVIEFKVYVDGEYLNTYISDGILVSTPSGSTAYSLSCGGPILTPTLQGTCITAICPHSLNARPIVIPSCASVKLQIFRARSNAVLSVDGVARESLKQGSELYVLPAEYHARFVRLDTNFYKRLLEKLNSWSATKP